MNETNERLRSIVEAETELFCRAKHELQTTGTPAGAVHDDVRLYARETQCGYATAFVQHGLKVRHGIETERLAGEPPLAPRDSFGRRLRHIILQHEDTLIDPTYGQWMAYAGVRAGNNETVSAQYPDRLALLVDTRESEEVLEPLAEELLTTASSERSSLVDYAPFRGMGATAILAVMNDIYTRSHYESYPTRPEHPSFAYTQRLLDVGASLQGEV